ncbi:hypothetical protein VTL71DRAFT_5677 [Oculimacula yallundae]|uniref:Uncharacterized protein n=1 Tax=Oculimacula yallundae TaxID=86028 RepID=A0ABR4BY75_9HELO
MSTALFASATSASALCHHLVANGKLSPLSDFTSSYDHNTSDIYEEVRNNHKEVRDGGDILVAKSLATALSSLAVLTRTLGIPLIVIVIPLVQSSLMNLVHFLIEAHIDSALNDLTLPQLRTLAKNDKLKQLYREILTTEDPAVHFSIADNSSRPFSGESYRSNLLYVYEFFRRGNTPYLVGSVPNTDSADGSFADVVKAWLEQIKAPSEKATFSDVFNKVLTAQTSTQIDGDVKDWPKFTQDLMQIVLPVALVYLPDLDMASGLPLIVENALASMAPQAMSNEAIKSKLLTSIPQNTLGFAQELSTNWAKQIRVLERASLLSIDKDTAGEIYMADRSGGDMLVTLMHQIQDHQYGVGLAAA